MRGADRRRGQPGRRGTVIATELGAQAAPDGYTLLSASDTLIWSAR